MSPDPELSEEMRQMERRTAINAAIEVMTNLYAQALDRDMSEEKKLLVARGLQEMFAPAAAQFPFTPTPMQPQLPQEPYSFVEHTESGETVYWDWYTLTKSAVYIKVLPNGDVNVTLNPTEWSIFVKGNAAKHFAAWLKEQFDPVDAEFVSRRRRRFHRQNPKTTNPAT